MTVVNHTLNIGTPDTLGPNYFDSYHSVLARRLLAQLSHQKTTLGTLLQKKF